MSAAERAVESIRRAREYTVHLLGDIPTDDWFRMPHERVSHVAWQVGHLAFAEYRLALQRIRGQKPGDEQLIAPAFLEKFGRNSTPLGDPSAYPPPDEIRRVFDAVHRRALEEVSSTSDAVLAEPADPHPRFSTKAGSLVWCAEHEMMHAGQVGLLRRLLGKPPLW
jgi:uncharacterized damage-inducible protein DinB